MNKKPVVSVVIPNWNGKHLLKECLPTLKKQNLKKFETIIIDNGSIDGSAEYVKNYFPEIILIKLKKNIGFAPAVNLGIKKAKGKYIFLLNNDTKLDQNCLRFLIGAADDHPEAGFVTAKILQFYHPELIGAAGDYIDEVGHGNSIGFGEKDGPKFNIPGYVFLVTAGGSLFKRKLFEVVGLFDEDYFAYFEDADLCFRSQMQGFKGWYQPQAVIYHIQKATSGKNKPFLEYLQFRNMMMTIIKDFPRELFFTNLNFLKIALVNLNTIRYLTRHGYLLSALKAEWYIISHIGILLRKRKEVQTKINVPIEYIIAQVRPKKISFFGLF